MVPSDTLSIKSCVPAFSNSITVTAETQDEPFRAREDPLDQVFAPCLRVLRNRREEKGSMFFRELSIFY